MAKKPKTTIDLTTKHFSRYGEFLASFELSKHGWDTYIPVYDEYIDLIIHKIICKSCSKIWNVKPKLICKGCKKEITSSKKDKIIANVKCLDCDNKFKKQPKCPKCKSKNLENIPACPLCKKGVVEIQDISCQYCGSKQHKEKFRTIQVKASRLEPNGKTYAVDLRPRDLKQGDKHFYIWVCIDERDIPHFIVVPIRKFEKDDKNFINSISFLKDQGREHFNSNTFGKWGKYVNRFDLLE